MVVVAITGLNNADDDGLENVGDERWFTDTHTFISENHSAINTSHHLQFSTLGLER